MLPPIKSFYSCNPLGHLDTGSTLLPTASYDESNNGWDTFEPFFSSDIADPPEECSGDPSCIFDYHVTGDISVALTSMTISMENNDTLIGLGEWKLPQLPHC